MDGEDSSGWWRQRAGLRHSRWVVTERVQRSERRSILARHSATTMHPSIPLGSSPCGGLPQAHRGLTSLRRGAVIACPAAGKPTAGGSGNPFRNESSSSGKPQPSKGDGSGQKATPDASSRRSSSLGGGSSRGGGGGGGFSGPGRGGSDRGGRKTPPPPPQKKAPQLTISRPLQISLVVGLGFRVWEREGGSEAEEGMLSHAECLCPARRAGRPLVRPDCRLGCHRTIMLTVWFWHGSE